MNFKKYATGVVVVSALSTVGVVQAGPEVEVTFKNNSSSEAFYDTSGSSAYSYGEASPKPAATVAGGESNISRVKGGLSADVTSVVFQYRIGSKTCKFKTSYLKLPGRGVPPRWSKSSEPGGGARCEARITATNVSTHAWAVEFTMR
jgi:hypothetical protein